MIRRPTSAGVSPMNVAARRVKRRMRRSASSITMGISTASRRFRRSALTSCSSWFRPWSSSLTVVSSSLVDWSSSLAVSSSSLRLWSSSLPETSSSLAEASASVPRPCSSSSDATYSFVAASSSSSARRAAASTGRSGPGTARCGAGRGGRALLEEHHERPLASVGRLHREHDEVAGPAGAVPVDRDALLAHRGGRLACLRERDAQRGGEAGARHLEELALGLARRRLEVRTGPPAELDHLQVLVDDDAGRAVARQDQRRRRCRARAPSARGGSRPSVAGRRAARRGARRRAARSGTCSARACGGRACRPCSPGANHLGTPEVLSERPRRRKPGWLRQ